MNVVERFLSHLQAEGKNGKTIKQYASNLNRFIRWLDVSLDEGAHRGDGGCARLKSATHMDVANFKRSMLETYKPSTVAQTLIHVAKFFDYLVDIGEVIDNPAKHVDSVTVEVKAPKWLTRNEQNALIRAVRQHGDIRELAIITMLLHTGLRVDELVNVKVSDIFISERKGKVVVPPNLQMTSRYTLPDENDLQEAVEQLS